ncbi:MAG: adenosylcobinamide-phosphate synthase CbiB [Pseudomonadota bacterium]
MSLAANAPILILLAWVFEVAIGWPDRLYKRIGHPVVWIGSLISFFEQTLNRNAWSHAVRYIAGAMTTLLIVAVVTTVAVIIAQVLPPTWWGIGLEAMIASSLIASRSLYAHVVSVARPLAEGNMDDARQAVSMIVGRDPTQLSPSGIARASLESLAENASDGVVAPVFWGAIFGLPGLSAYKTINTLDSMIGHKNDRYAAFGGCAARLDDLANIIPARLTGLLIATASIKTASFTLMFRDARFHRSPNAGWPEAAMAGALGVRLSGPRTYNDLVTNDAWLNQWAHDPEADDVRNGLVFYIRAMALGAALLVLIAVGISSWGSGR